MDPIFFLESVKTISATTLAVIRLVDYFAGHEPLHVKERLGRSLELMSKYMHEKNQSKDPGDAWRNDWFHENQVSNHRTLRRLIEKTVKEIINDSEERKSEYIPKFLVNVCRTANSDIDEATAFEYLEAIESLSWRQLCIISLVILSDNCEVSMDRIDASQVERMPKDKQTSYGSISRDFEKLRSNGYYKSVASMISGKTHEPLLDIPTASPDIPNRTRRLYSLMNLYEIQIEEIVENFSMWNVRPRKSE